MRYALILFILSLSLMLPAQPRVVQTHHGKVEGGTNADQSVRIFKGVPFAAPPVDDLRWKAPQPPPDWKGIRRCNAFSASPIQNKPEPFYCWSEAFIAQPEPLSEDCLYLNIWTSARKKRAKQPVFVWIYGGGLSSGSANCAVYDGEEMAKKGVVFVSINYRVGVLGFMAHPELSKESGHHASGNYGFLDQIAALQWIQKNIAAFGGDPNNVTIAGQSAGSFSVHTLVASPLAKGLFHKAIAQSGGLLANKALQNLENAEQQGMRFMQKANAASIAELRKIPAETLQQINIGQGFGVTLDNYVLPVDLLEYFKKGHQNQVPIMTGWVTGDGDFLGANNKTVADYQKDAKTVYGDRADAFLKIFPAETEDAVQTAQKKLTLLGFAAFPAHLLATYNTKNTYLYQFSHVPTDKPGFPNYGAFHTSEVPFALHTLHLWKRSWQPADREVEKTMSEYWVNFAKTGDPNGRNLPDWSPYNPQNGSIMILKENPVLQADLFRQEFDFLEGGL